MCMMGVAAVFMSGAGCTSSFACRKIVLSNRTACLWSCFTTIIIVGKQQEGEVLFLLHLLYPTLPTPSLDFPPSAIIGKISQPSAV